MATALSQRGIRLAVANRTDSVWKMAEESAKNLAVLSSAPLDIRAVQDFLRTEVSREFSPVETLEKGVGVHHAGLPDQARSLMEQLAASGCLHVLCVTAASVAQGIDFPVSSVFLQTWKHPSGKMSPRGFWNLPGCAGRFDHDSMGIVGRAQVANRQEAVDFASPSTGSLVSMLVMQREELAKTGELANLSNVLWHEQWDDFRRYMAHLWKEGNGLDAVLPESERLLRQTFGYTAMRNDPARRKAADSLLQATGDYLGRLAGMNGNIPALTDPTGLSPEGVIEVMAALPTPGPMTGCRKTSSMRAAEWRIRTRPCWLSRNSGGSLGRQTATAPAICKCRN